ncbi:MAG TPA: glycosyltransferase [Cytophagaceae bacterium]
MKILIALSRFPYPTDKGDKLRAYYQIRDLSRNNELYVICLTEEMPSEKDKEHIRSYCKQLEIIPLNTLSKYLNLFFGIFNRRPFQVNYFQSSQMEKKIGELLEKEAIDLCYIQLLRLVNNVPFGRKTTYYLDYMDALSEGMRKRLRYSRWFEKPLVNWEFKRLRKFEEEIASYFAGYSIISKPDAEVFSEKIKQKISIIPNGVNEDFFVDTRSAFDTREYDVIFTGNMGYHPNVQACKYLVNQILPLLLKRFKKIKICLAGTSPSQEVLALQGEHVVVTGFVEDIKSWLLNSKLFVAPLFSGSGLQNKLLESMATGLPTLTTSLANSALKAEEGKQIIVCDDAESFAENIINLLENEEKAETLGLAGQAFIKENYNWSACNQKLESELQDCLMKIS